MSAWQALKPGWRSALNACWAIMVAAMVASVYPWVAFGMLAANMLAWAWLSGAQTAAIKEVKAAAQDLIEGRE